MTRLAATVATLVISAAASAHAAPPGETSPQASQDSGYDPKSPTSAIALSAVGTLVPMGVLVLAANTNTGGLGTIGVLGLIAGPSIGHWYAGDYLTAGLGMRAAGTVLLIVGFSEAFSCIGSGDVSCEPRGQAPLVVGAGMFIGGTIYDIATAGSAAHRWNAHHLTVAPTRVGTGPQATTGLALGGTF